MTASTSPPGPRSEPVLLLITLATSLWLMLAMPVFAQESYYWSYSQHPDLSYYDHPPMVAWLIWLSSSVFGDGALGIRLGSWLCGCAIVLAGLGLLREFSASPRARMTWLVLCMCVPSVVATRFLTNPDPALCGFWMLTLLTLWKARSGNLGWWVVAGLMSGCALLSKYTAIFLAVGGAIVLLADPAMRRQLRRPGPYLGVLTAALTFLPVIWWNVANAFESFRFQTSGRWEHAQFGLHWLTQFVGGQLLVLHPAVAVMLPAIAWWLWRSSRGGDIRTTWLLAFGGPMAVFLLGSAVMLQVKINWFVPAALPLLVGAAMWWSDSGFAARRPTVAKLFRRSLVAMPVILLLAPLIILFPQRRGTSWTGWEEIAARAEHWEGVIDEPDGIEGNVFFFAGDYRDAAQLARNLKRFAAASEPGEPVEPTLAQNVIGKSALQFDHWEPPQDRIGEDAIFVLPRPEMREGLLQEVRERFDSIERVESVQVTRLGIEVLKADIYVCRQYRGPVVN